MSLPTLRVLIAFDTHPTATPTYTDVSAYVQSLAIRRGRQKDLEPIPAGTCQLRLLNTDRRFDPTNSTGPYAPNVIPMKRVQISAIHGGSTYWLFDGFVDDWLVDYRDTKISWTSVRATDGFKIFNFHQLNTIYPLELSSDRIVRVLEDVGWAVIAGWETGNVWVLEDAASQLGVNTWLGAGGQQVFSGQSYVQGSTLADVTALAHMQAVADAEGGQLFMSAAGDVTFHDRHHRNASTISATYSDTGSTAHGYQTYQLDSDDAGMANNVRFQIEGNTTASVVNDSASQAKYFVRTYVKSGLLITSTAEAYDAASWHIQKYKDPHPHVQQLGFKMVGHSDTTSKIDAILGRDIGDRVQIVRTPPGGGTITTPAYIEGITHDLPAPGLWTTTFHVESADRYQFWTLSGSTNSTADYSTFSVLDATTILGY